MCVLTWRALYMCLYTAAGKGVVAELRATADANALPPQPAFDESVRAAALADASSSASSPTAGAGGGVTRALTPPSPRNIAAAPAGPESVAAAVPGVSGRDPRDSVPAAGRVAVRRSGAHTSEVVRMSQIARINLEREEGGAYATGRGNNDDDEDGGDGGGGGGRSGGGKGRAVGANTRPLQLNLSRFCH